jgi:hypothetical protein
MRVLSNESRIHKGPQWFNQQQVTLGPWWGWKDLGILKIMMPSEKQQIL